LTPTVDVNVNAAVAVDVLVLLHATVDFDDLRPRPRI